MNKFFKEDYSQRTDYGGTNQKQAPVIELESFLQSFFTV